MRTYLFDYLKSVSTPIFLYGMGNGADKIIEQCEKRNIKIEGIFASDEFVRGQTFHGMTVQSYSQVRSKHSDIIILLCFGSSLPDVLDRIYALANQNELYAVATNYSGFELDTEITINNGYKVKKIIRGEIDKIAPFETLIVKLKKN